MCVCVCVCVCVRERERERERARACMHVCLCLEGILQSLEAVFRIGCSDYRKGCCGRFYGQLGSQGWVPFLNWTCGTPASPFHFDAEAAWNFGSSVWESRTAGIIQVRATLRSQCTMTWCPVRCPYCSGQILGPQRFLSCCRKKHSFQLHPPCGESPCDPRD